MCVIIWSQMLLQSIQSHDLSHMYDAVYHEHDTLFAHIRVCISYILSRCAAAQLYSM